MTDWFALLERDREGEAAELASVGTEQALRVSAVQACVRILSDTVAGLPLHLYKRAGKGKERADAHPAARVLRAPNARMTALDLRKALITNRLLQGNGYAPLLYEGNGRLTGIDLVEAWRVQVFRTDGGMLYRWHDAQGIAREATQERMIHLRGLSGNGLVGYSVIHGMAQDAIALGYAQQQQARSFMATGSRLSGILSLPNNADRGVIEKLRTAWAAAYGGPRNAGKVAVLDNGASFSSTAVAPEDAQFLEQRQFSVADIARMFGVPPHLIGAQGSTSYASAEQNSLEFVVFTILPLAQAIEATLNKALLSESEQESLFFAHTIDGLLRGDAKSRNEAYAIGVQNGWLSRNEVRALENMNPVDGLDEYLAPMNMTTAPALAAVAEQQTAGNGEQGTGNSDSAAGSATREPTPTARGRRWAPRELRALVVISLDDPHVHEERADAGRDNTEPDDDGGLTEAQRAVRQDRQDAAESVIELWQDAAGRLVRREVADLRRRLQGGALTHVEMVAWLEQFYRELQPVAGRYFAATLRTSARLAAATVERELGERVSLADLAEYLEEYLGALSGAWTQSSLGQLRSVIEMAVAAAEPGTEDVTAAEAVRTRVGEWEERRAEKTGRRQAYASINGGAVACMGLLGVSALRWLSTGRSCPHCRSLSGKRVALGSSFTDGQLTVGGQTMQVYGIKKHAPLHDGCDCTVGAA